MTCKNLKIAQPKITVSVPHNTRRYKICFKFITSNKDFNFHCSSLATKDICIVMDKMRQICSISKLDFMGLARQNGIEFMPRIKFKENIFDSFDQIEKQSKDTKFISIRFGGSGRLIFRECNMNGEDDVLHFLAIDPNHKLY